MAQELFTNGAQSTLSAGINNSTTSIGVADGSVFPSTGLYRVRIDDEILLVTGRSGNTLSVQRGQEATSAASHDSGAAVKQILTAGSLRRATLEQGADLTASGQHAVAQGVACSAGSAQSLARGFRAVARHSTALVEASGMPDHWTVGDAQRIRLSLTGESDNYEYVTLAFAGSGESRDPFVIVPPAATWLAHLRVLGVNSAGSVCAWERHLGIQCNTEGTAAEMLFGGGNELTPNLVGEFTGYLTIEASGGDPWLLISCQENDGGLARWHASLDITELIHPIDSYGYGYGY